MPRQTRRLLVVFIIVLVGLTAGVLWLSRGDSSISTGAITTDSPVQIGGSFSLTDQNGKHVTDADFRGKLMLVFFGFTHCPDICPTTLTEFTNVMNALGDKAQGVVPVFITVDPARDTPEVIKEYLANFHPSIVGLTGTEEEIKATVSAYKVYAAKHNAAEAATTSDYLMDHSGFIYLMDRNGAYLAHFSQEDPQEKISQSVQEHLR